MTHYPVTCKLIAHQGFPFESIGDLEAKALSVASHLQTHTHEEWAVTLKPGVDFERKRVGQLPSVFNPSDRFVVLRNFLSDGLVTVFLECKLM